jgi:oligopeptide/dipeptide ABC transporter ATP-binding protein
MKETVLKALHLTVKLKIDGKTYPVVDDLSFELKKGQTLALVGESGCGKSMTALSILRILPEPPSLPPEGEIFYMNRNLLKLPEKEMRTIRGKKISMIFQNPISALNPVFTIGSQLTEVAETHLSVDHASAKQAALKALAEVHLPTPHAVLNLYPHELSGGMLQRVMIAMALICSPDILIADEPTTALDVTIQSQILNLLKELQHKTGMAILLITHDMGVVAHNADEVIVMYAGSSLEQGSVYALFDNPSHPYSQALFSAQPQLKSQKKKLAAISGFVPRITHLPQGCAFHPRCQFTMDNCKKGKIPFFHLDEEGHRTRCWLFDKTKNAE